MNYTYTISRSTERVTGQRQPQPYVISKLLVRFIRATHISNLSLRDGFLVWQQLQADDLKLVLPIMYGALGAWWVFIFYRVIRTIHRPAIVRS